MTECAGHSAQGRSKQWHRCEREVPKAVESFLEAGRVRRTVTPRAFQSPMISMCAARSVESSSSRSIHQAPTIIAFRGPMGPPVVQGEGSPGRRSRKAKGRACARVGGPSPRSQLRMESLRVR